ncbi:MAG: flagellar biosynthetic protein FliR [Angelakisella sp.]|nr:flagellar biosynthetic protein FliR [Angelakisella sp.]
MISLSIENIAVYILVFVRMLGMIAFNPLFARRNVPSQVRMGLVICLTLVLSPTIDTVTIASFNELDLILSMFKELIVGLTCGFVFQIFYYLIFFAGDILDVQFGLSMAKIFDPGTNIQMSITGNLIGLMFILYILMTDSYLLMIKIFTTSYMIIPAGAVRISPEISGFIFDLFIQAFVLIIKLTLPFIAAEFTLEIAMGVLMKLIPQIHVFVINIQFKLLLGVFLLFIFAPAISGFVDNYMNIMFQSMQKALYTLA